MKTHPHRGWFVGLVLWILSAFGMLASVLPAGQTLEAITFGNGSFVAVGSNGVIYSSLAGGPWQARNSGTTNHLSTVAYGMGGFVAAGENGTILSSPDGTIWTERSVLAQITSPQIAFGNGRLVIVGNGPPGIWTALLSTNGLSWESLKIEAGGPSSATNGLPFGGVAFGAGKFLAAGGVHGANLFVSSVDGIHWIEHGTTGAVGGNNGRVVGPLTYGAGKFAVRVEHYSRDDYGNQGSSYQLQVISEDGVNWRYEGSVAFTISAVALADCEILVAPTSTPGLIWFSRNNLSWTTIALPAGTSVRAIASGASRHVAVGNDIVEFDLPPADRAFALTPSPLTLVESSGTNVGRYFTPDIPCLDPPVRFQWTFNGDLVPDATNAWLELVGAKTNYAGAYSLIARGGTGLSVTSIVAQLIVVTPTQPPKTAPKITSPFEPVSYQLALRSSLILDVLVDAWPPPSYQWKFNGADLPNATNRSLMVGSFDPGMAGTYSVVVRNPLGTATSPPMSLQSTSVPPVTVSNFYDASVLEGHGLPFFLFQQGPAAEGSPPALRVVTRDGLPVDLALTGGPRLVLHDVSAGDAGTYSLLVSNSVGTATGFLARVAVTPAGPIDRWSQRNPLPQYDALRAVAAGDDEFVAIGSRGTVVTSTNGAQWSLHRLKGEVELSGIAFGNGTYVAVGEQNILTSSHGTYWNVRWIGSDLVGLHSVVFGNGRFVVVGDQRILTSLDTLSWEDAILGVVGERFFRDVAFGNGMFLAIGLGGTVWTSRDGVAWAPSGSLPPNTLTRLTYAEGQFVAVGTGGAVSTSPDGVIWKQRNSGVSTSLLDVTSGRGRFVAVGARGRIISSPGAGDWRKENSGTPDRLEALVFGHGLFVAVGESGTILSSIDGSTWLKQNLGTTRDLDGMATSPDLLLVAGKHGTILTSTDGASFVERPTGITNDLHAIHAAEGLYVAVGEPETILTSTDAANWTLRRAGGASSLKSVYRAAGLWVAVGTQGVVLTSEDGVTWQRSSSPTANDLNDVTFGNGLFVAVGDNLPPNGTLMTSPDGKSWTRRGQYLGKNLRSVSFVNKVFVATANDGMLLLSTNGLDWRTQFTGQFNNLRTVTYGVGRWFAVGNEGVLLTSTNLLEWEDHSPSFTENLHGVGYFRNHFVTIGNRGTVLQSDLLSRPATLAARFVETGLQLDVFGDIGTSYRLESTDELPASSWRTLRSFTLLDTVTNLVDLTTSESPTRFYRVSSP